MTADFFRDLVAQCDAVQRAEHLTDTQMAERGGMRREQFVRARNKGRTGEGDVETMTAEAFARIAGVRVGLLSGDHDPLAAALSDAVAALRRADAAAEVAVDRGALSLIRPAIRDMERLLGAQSSPARGAVPRILPGHVSTLDLTARVERLLVAAGVVTVDDLTHCVPGVLLKIPGFGPGCLQEVVAALAAHGLRLAGGA